MIPQLIIRKQYKGEYTECMAAKMNLQVSKTVEILIWNCPTPSYPFTRTSLKL